MLTWSHLHRRSAISAYASPHLTLVAYSKGRRLGRRCMSGQFPASGLFLVIEQASFDQLLNSACRKCAIKSSCRGVWPLAESDDDDVKKCELKPPVSHRGPRSCDQRCYSRWFWGYALPSSFTSFLNGSPPLFWTVCSAPGPRLALTLVTYAAVPVSFCLLLRATSITSSL